MKKFYVSFVFLLLVSAIGFGQSKSFGPGKLNIGIDGASIVGAYGDVYTSGLGFSAKFELPVNKNVYGTLSTGYESIFTKSDSVSQRGYKSSYDFLPTQIGLKYCYKGHFFAEGQVGIVLSTGASRKGLFADQTLTSPTFIYSIGVGYTVSRGVEAGFRYEGWDEGVTFKQLALRLAYRF